MLKVELPNFGTRSKGSCVAPKIVSKYFSYQAWLREDISNGYD